MDNSMVEVLMAQGMSKSEAFQRIALYYQLLAEGCTRAEARRAFRSAHALSYLEKLVSSAIHGIIEKGFQPEEVEDAIQEYYRPFTLENSCEFDVEENAGAVSDFPLDEEPTAVVEELGDLIRDDREKEA